MGYIDSSIRLFAGNCIIYRKVTNKNDIENLQKYLNNLGEWAVENGIKINRRKSKTIRFRRAWVKNQVVNTVDEKKFWKQVVLNICV